MRMVGSVIAAVAVAVAVAGCGPGSTEVLLRPAPPSLAVSGTTRVVVDGGGHPQLEVAAQLRNPNNVHIVVGIGSACPLYVRLFPDPSGVVEVSSGGPVGCPASAFTLDLAPGDSAVLTKDIPSDSLAGLVPGLYGVNVGIAAGTATMGGWAGTVNIPLSAGP